MKLYQGSLWKQHTPKTDRQRDSKYQIYPMEKQENMWSSN